MKKSKALRMIEQVAMRENKSVTEVREDMQIAITAGFDKEDKTEYQQAFWSRWKKPPTPEEFLSVASAKVMDELGF